MPALPTATDSNLPRRHANFETLLEALDYVSGAASGVNFYSGRGELLESATYAELVDRAIGLGRRFINLGIRPQDRIALIAQTGADFPTYFIACQYAGALPVPMPMPVIFGGREAYTDQIARQVQSSNARCLIASEDMIELVRDAVESLDLDFVGTPSEFESLPIGSADPKLTAHPGELAYLQYSSGSTRFPLGVAVTHHSLMFNMNQMSYHGMRLIDDDRCTSWLPFYHDMGLVGFFLVPITTQMSVDYLSPDEFARRPLQWLNLITRNRGTLSYSPIFGYELAQRRVGEEAMKALDLSSWRCAGIGGDMVRPEVIESFSETFAPCGFDPKVFVPSYGLAENTLAVSIADAGTDLKMDLVDEESVTNKHFAAPVINGAAKGVRPRRYVECGTALKGTTIEIRDEDGAVMGERGVGRIHICGESVMAGYYGNEEATREVLSEDGWFDTGDMGYFVGENLFIVGRLKDMMILNGRNVWPQDIEWAVENLPQIKAGDVAAFAVTAPGGAETATVLVQCRLRDEDVRDALVGEVRAVVQKTMGIAPDVFLVPHRSLPKTSSGKLSRIKSKNLFLDGGFSPEEEAPRARASA